MAEPLHIADSLQKQKENGLYRALSVHNNLADFCSNDFFGLSGNKKLINNVLERFSEVNFLGSTGSRLISGNNPLYEKLEKKLSQIHQAEAALIFNSGYNANLSLFSYLPQKNDTVLYDEKVHASIKDGIRLGFVKKISFKHNDHLDLEKKIKTAQGNVFVVVESLYSMDGDFCEIELISEVCNKNKSYLIVDEAHTTGIYGESAGWCVEKGVLPNVFARIMTFGKALGTFGACVLGSENLKNYLINFSRPFIYTTALPSLVLISIDESFNYIQQNYSLLRTTLETNIESFTGNKNSSAIQAKFIDGGNEKVKNAAKLLMNKGFYVKPILSPTVPQGEERLRICIHTFNDLQQISTLKNVLREI